MKRVLMVLLGCGGVALLPSANAATITVTTTNNLSSTEMSLAKALSMAGNGDSIHFNLPGPGPHYIATPPSGYPQITNHNVTIDGYSQAGSSPNTNPILAPNNAKIQVILDSRDGGRTVLDYDGYSTSESAILGVVGATNFSVRGLGFLGRLVRESEISDADPALYCVSFAAKATHGHVSGCWFGVDANGTNVFGANAGVTGFRFRENGIPFLSDHITVGVKAGSTNALAEFNVIAGQKIPIIIEGERLRVSGNFINVLPNGTNDYNNALRGFPNEGGIQVGRHGGGTVIGTDGDGVNDSHERNIFGGVIPRTAIPLFDPQLDARFGYHHVIEFYGGGPRNDVVVAGNYFGVGIDGQTRFTNGVPIVSGQTGNTRIGSDFDGVSDDLEGNLIANNFPPGKFSGETIVRDFLDGVGAEAFISVRGNRLINNFTPPVSPLRDNGGFVAAYYGKVFDPSQGLAPVLSTNSTTVALMGTIPRADTNFYPTAVVDLYLPDPEGIATGKAAGIPDLPNGFLQGLAYLGSFAEGSRDDLNPKAGEFEFDLGRLRLAAGVQVLATVTYSQQRLGVRNAPGITSLFSNIIELGPAPVSDAPIAFSRSGNSLTLTWPGGGFVLQSAARITGPWNDVGTAGNTFTAQTEGEGQFYRLIRRGAPPPVSGSPALKVSRTDTSLSFSWEGSGFVVQSSPSAGGPWTNEQTSGNAFTASLAGESKFFRLIKP